MIAIMIAAEISYGAIIILPTVSATNKTIAPINKLIGIKCLCSVPTNNLEIWGTSKPIKAITPTTATLILHNKTANNDKLKEEQNIYDFLREKSYKKEEINQMLTKEDENIESQKITK